MIEALLLKMIPINYGLLEFCSTFALVNNQSK